jgi:hypothetical protein
MKMLVLLSVTPARLEIFLSLSATRHDASFGGNDFLLVFCSFGGGGGKNTSLSAAVCVCAASDMDLSSSHCCWYYAGRAKSVHTKY